MVDLPDLKTGIYRHYKGPLYEVAGYSHDANIEGRITVLYRSLELTDAHEGPRWAHRNVVGEDNFFDLVTSEGIEWKEHEAFLRAEGQDCACEPVWRFEYLGPQYLKGMRDS